MPATGEWLFPRYTLRAKSKVHTFLWTYYSDSSLCETWHCNELALRSPQCDASPRIYYHIEIRYARLIIWKEFVPVKTPERRSNPNSYLLQLDQRWSEPRTLMPETKSISDNSFESLRSIFGFSVHGFKKTPSSFNNSIYGRVEALIQQDSFQVRHWLPGKGFAELIYSVKELNEKALNRWKKLSFKTNVKCNLALFYFSASCLWIRKLPASRAFFSVEFICLPATFFKPQSVVYHIMVYYIIRNYTEHDGQ